jgi:hypothetical protein
VSEDEAPENETGEGMEVEPSPVSTVGPPAAPATPGSEVGKIELEE